MRILFLNPVGIIGGAERALLDLLSCLPSVQPHWVRELVVGSEGPLVQAAEALGVRVHVVPLPAEALSLGDAGLRHRSPHARVRFAGELWRAGTTLPAYAHKLRSAIRAARPDVVHSNGIKSHLLSWVTLGLRVATVWHVHDFLSERALARHALSWMEGSADAVIANSEAVGGDIRKVLKHLPVHVVPNGTDLERFSPGPTRGPWLDELAGRPPAPEGTLRLGLVATYARWKGHDRLLRALGRLRQEEDALPFRLYLVGGPLYETPDSQFSAQELRALAAEVGLAEHTAFVPFQAETADVYRSLDIVVHASTRREPFGLTIAESLACARPSIVSRSSGAAEHLEHGRDAWLVSSEGVEGLVEALRTLRGDSDLRNRLGKQGRATALTQFSRLRYTQAISAVYQGLEQRAGSP